MDILNNSDNQAAALFLNGQELLLSILYGHSHRE